MYSNKYKTNREYPEYSNWKNMRARCSSPSIGKVRNYQANNIADCETWNSFRVFLDDMGPKPKGYSIERKDNLQGYNPDNCIWADDLTQGRNTSRVRTYTVKGFTGCIPEIAEHFKVNSNSIHKALYKGRDIEEILTSLLVAGKVEYKGHFLTKAEWAAYLGVKRPTMYNRFSKHKDLDLVFKGYDIPGHPKEE